MRDPGGRLCPKIVFQLGAYLDVCERGSRIAMIEKSEILDGGLRGLNFAAVLRKRYATQRSVAQRDVGRLCIRLYDRKTLKEERIKAGHRVRLR